MTPENVGQSPRWLIYGATSLLGISFAYTLVTLAWSNTIERRKQDFAIETALVNEHISRNIHVCDDLIEYISAFINSNQELTENQFDLFSEHILFQHQFIEGMYYAVPDNESSSGNTTRSNTILPVKFSFGRSGSLFPPDQDLFSSLSLGMEIRNLFDSGAVHTVPAVINQENKIYFLLLRLLVSEEAGINSDRVPNEGITGVLVEVIDPEKLITAGAIPKSVTYSIFSESSGIGGRNILLNRQVEKDDRKWLLKELSEEEIILFPGYSIKLDVSKPIFWQDINKDLIFISLIIGIGMTLLIIALQRSKEIQARELKERNIVIERKVEEQTRELAVARDQALDASRMKSDFLASMSHEIRTPLNAIIGMTELLSETSLNTDQEKYVNVFKRAGDTLLSLVNDILDLSKIEASQMKLESIRFNLIDVVEEAVEIYALKATEKNIELICRVDPGIEKYRMGDPVRIRQILLNLISNALKFTEKGEILVHVTGDPDSKDLLRFSVIDTGIGISKDKSVAIFESFTQADTSTTRKYGGTGLGLTICKSLVELMGGKIQVESEEGRGSTFSFLVSLPGDKPVSGEAEITQEFTGDRVLLATDNKTNAIKITEILQTLGLEVISTDNGKEAIKLISGSNENNNGFFLVIINSQLADMTGPELLNQLVESHSNTRLALMMNPVEVNEQIKVIEQYGIENYLVKPVKQDELILLVNNVRFGHTGKEAVAVDAVRADYQGETGKKILLVDDNPDNRLLIRAYLKKTPVEVREAENGKVALALFQEEKFDLVFMDIHMPEMDGHEATRSIRTWEKNHQRTETPVIALTAHATREEIEKCIQSGCNRHLGKPIKKEKLMEILQAYI